MTASSPYSGTIACDVSGSTSKNIVSARTVPVRPLLTKPPLGCQDRYDEREASLAPYVSPCDASLTPFSSLHRQTAGPARTGFLVVVGLTLLAACTSAPRSGPPGGDRDSGSRARQVHLQGLSAPPAALLLVSMDTDRDHYVSRQELDAGIDHEWQLLAGPNEVRQSAVRMSNWSAETLGDINALPSPIAFDSNLDGTITDQEFRVRLTDTFDQMDKDHDGALSRAELLAAPRATERDEGAMPQDSQRRGPPPGRRQ